VAMKLITTKDAAEKLGVSQLRVQQLIWSKRLPAQKIGRDYMIQEGDLKLVADRKPGRPRKADNVNEAEREASKKAKRGASV
jgi:excisionase family DNA binding protein